MAIRIPHLAASLVAHAAVVVALGQTRPLPSQAEPAARTEFVPVELPPQPPPPPPPPEEPAEPERVDPPRAPAAPPPKPAPRLAPLESSAAGATEAAVALPDPAPRTPLRLTGVSLSNAEPTPATRPTAKPRPAAAVPTVTPLADLSRRPVPPRLDASLRNHYPAELRRRGIEGEALVRVHVSEAGQVTRVEPVSGSAPEFSRACRETLLGTEWGAPLDTRGRPVRTALLYRCRFRVGS